MTAYQCGVRRKSLDVQVVVDDFFVRRLLLKEIKSDECLIEPFVGCASTTSTVLSGTKDVYDKDHSTYDIAHYSLR